MADPDSEDDALTARFKSLRGVQSRPKPPSAEEDYSPDVERAAQDLLDRYKQLRGTPEAAQAPAPESTEHNEEDDKELDDLLDELQDAQGEVKLESSDEWRATKLIEEARAALEASKLEEEEQQGGEAVNPTGTDTARDAGDSLEADDKNKGKTEQQMEEEETILYIQQALEEAELDKQREDQESRSVSPSHKTIPDAAGGGNEEEDDEPSLSSLSNIQIPSSNPLSSLPVIPTTKPTAPPKQSSSSKKYTDEEIDSWCCICLANATVKCLGCDGDLYCALCWREGHTGEDAGYEEKTHRAVTFSPGNRKGKKMVAA